MRILQKKQESDDFCEYSESFSLPYISLYYVCSYNGDISVGFSFDN